MMTTNIFPWALTEMLHEGRESSLIRAVRTTDGRRAILKVLDPRCSRSDDIDRLKHEYAIGKALDIRNVVRPLALETFQGLPALVMEDFGGESLDRLLGAPMGTERFLQLAIRIATAIAEVHRHGIIHRDIKPYNIIVDPRGEVKLTDFGLASRLPLKHTPPQGPTQIGGSLPYMSPEQTGRMNRAVDSRTDLYSLGVTFYQMLTGRLPFEARDPLEWIHAHIARAPPPVSEIVPEVPEEITRIVTKLLAKMADDRYQSAGGLVHDLERCLEAWSSGGRIELFPVGEWDVSDRLQIPQKLYGRALDTALLRRTFDRVVATGTPELLLVSGYSGSGKSSLVQELHKPVQERGIFLSGKFDQYTRDIPYATLVQSFTALVRDLLTEAEERLEGTRRALREALGVSGKLIIDMIPSLRLLLGEQPPVPELPPTEAERRFRHVFRSFLGVFAKREQPLALFLDDLQWADMGSLRLIEDMITDPDTRYLLLIGAYRDNEVTPSHPLMRALDRIRKAPAVVNSVVLSPLSLEHVVQLVADTVRADPERARPLAALVYEKTGGNPFFAIQFLKTLERERLLWLDEARPTWCWDIGRIQAQGHTDNVVDFMVRKLVGLPARTQDALKTAACIGSEAQAALLALAQGEPEEAILGDLWDALQEGLIDYTGETYTFAHDRVQQAAYSLLPEARRCELHLKIGRLLVLHTPPQKLEERIFDIVTQINAGAALITEPMERTRVAELNLRAARRAKGAAAYRAAVGYLVAGASLLGSDAWGGQYELMFALSLERAECEFLSGAFDGAGRLFDVLLQRARSRVDKAAVYRVKIDTHTTEGEDIKAIESALECLRMFGIDMSPHPSERDVDEAYHEVWRSLGDRRIEELIDLPLMTDPEMQAAMEILARLYAPAYHSDNNILYLHLCHGVNISLRYGNSPASTQAYGWFGLILASVFRRPQEGYRFAKLAFDLMERHRFLAYKAKAIFQLRIISYWTQPLDTMLERSRAAFEAAVETGDVPVACFSCHHTIMGMLIRGHSLSEVHREAERGLDFVRKAGFRDVYDMIVGIDRFVQAMRGRTRDLSTYDDDGFSEAEFESELARDRMPTLLFYYYVVKLMARFLSGDHEAALAVGEKSKGLLWAGLLSPQGQYFHFYHAMTLAAVFDDLPPEKQKEALDVLAAHKEQLRESAEGYPPTFHTLYALASAEIARIRSQNEEAMRLYDEAIRAARENGFVQHEALACELAARFYRARGFDLIADTYLREARARYARWGAEGKVKQIERQNPQLVEQRPLTPTTFLVRAEQIDMLSVVKASQTLSSEIVLEKLLRTLLEVVLEQGGAQRGCLILSRDSGLFIEAEAAFEEKGVATKILQSEPLSASPLVPISVVNYVVRTKERVMLDDAALPSKYASDPYVVRAKPRSLLGLPILRQGEVVGLLYLENNLVTGAFTPERLMALSLLASQAAISLENALLLAKEQAARAAAEEAERRSAFLAEAGEILSESLDDQEMLARLGRLSVRSLADWCAIHLVEGQEVGRISGAHRDPAKEPVLEELQRRYPPRRDSPHPGARVLWTGRPLLLPELSDEGLRAICEDEEHERLLRELGTRTELVVPLVAHGQIFGTLTLGSSAPGRRYGSADLELAQEAARRAAIALDNARLYHKTEEALQARDEFITVASHELNTPLTSLMLTLQSMGRAIQSGRSFDPPSMGKLAERALRQGTVLTRLSNDLLDVSRIQANRLPFVIEDVDLGALIRDVVEQFKPVLAEARCSVSVRDGDRVVGRWDRSRVEQVLTNLLSNAIKFGAGKPIEISTGEEAGIAWLTVKDHGIGVDPARQGHIFERFERAVSEKHYGGLGLGLYICRKIVETHGGSIRVESQPGAGATFTIELPCARPSQDDNRDRPHR